MEIYSSLRWRVTRSRALSRDGHRCTVSRLLGGACSGRLHVHHIHAVSEGGEPYELDNVATTCASHHPLWESLRRTLVERMLAGEPEPPRCRHRHTTREAREICERRMARQRERDRGRVTVAA